MQQGNFINVFLARHVSGTYVHHQGLSCSIWFSAPSFWMGCGAPHRTHDLRSGSLDHHASKNSVQKTICCNSTSNAPDDGRMYPKHVELRIRQPFASSWHFKLFQMEHIIYSLVHKYVLRTPQNMQCVSIRKTNR